MLMSSNEGENLKAQEKAFAKNPENLSLSLGIT